MPISTNYILTTDGIGGLNWQSGGSYLSTIIGYPEQLCTNKLSTSLITLSTMGIVDTQTQTLQILSASNGQLYLNGSPLVAGSGISQGQLTSTVGGLGTAGYISSSSLTASLTSTVAGLGSAGYVSSSQLVSTVAGLGSAGYVSSLSLNAALTSTVGGLGTAGYVSTSFLVSYVTNTNRDLGSLGYVSSTQLLSTSEGIYNTINSFSGAQTLSSVVIYGNGVFSSTVSIGILNLYSQDVSTLSTSIGQSLENNYYGWATSSQLFSTVVGIGGTGLISSGQLFSTVGGLGTAGYISSSQLISTVRGLGSAGYVSSSQLTSTVFGISSSISTFIFQTALPYALTSTVSGLGTAGYISSSQLTSTVRGLGSAGYVSSSQLVSTVAGLGTAGFLSQTSLTSTVGGLGTAGYVSTSYLSSFVSSINTTLGSIGYISTSSLVSTVRGLGSAGYISSTQLQSTVIGLGGVGLISSGQLISTVTGLGSAGYVSTASLYSTSIGLQQSFYVANANNVYVTNSQLTISTSANIIYLSSILLSSITYRGANGQIQASNSIPSGQPLYFSSATLPIDLFSTYITPRSFITIEASPTFLFSQLGLPSGTPTPIFMSSFIQNGRNYLSTFQANTMFYPVNTTQSNYVQPSIRISVPGQLLSNYFGTGTPIYLSHYLPNAATVGVTQGFLNCNVTVFYGSTNSVFLSIQNLP